MYTKKVGDPPILTSCLTYYS